MTKEFLAQLEQHKAFLKPETYERVKEHADKIPEEIQKRLIERFQKADQVKALIDEYDDQRMGILKEGLEKFKEIEGRMDQQYKEAYKKIEAEERKKAEESAEESLKQL